jgi:hypothetical protein
MACMGRYMPVHKIDQLKEELVTPKHSKARGQLVTGEQIELGLLRFKAGEGADTCRRTCRTASRRSRTAKW